MGIVQRGRDLIAREGAQGLAYRFAHRLAPSRLWLSESFNLPRVRSPYGLDFVANYSDATFRFYVLGTYGFYYWNHLRSIDYEFVFLDIGANQGLYAIGATGNKYLQRAYAFEPVKATFRLLLDNAKLNNAASTCVCINQAVSSESGSSHIAISPNHSGAATLAASNDMHRHADSGEEIMMTDATGLDAIVAEDSIPVVVKIDVEGFEATVIAELFKTGFADRIQDIFFEVDEAWVDVAALRTLLQANDFNDVQQVGSGLHYDLHASRS